MSDLSLTVSRVIDAPREAVFQAWLNPDMLARFMIPGDGMTVPSAEADAREGGRFSIVMQAGDNQIPHSGTYLTIDPHSKLVFTWESPFSADGSTVTIDLLPQGDGTAITLTHVKFPDEESRANHEGGWGSILSKLAALVS